jgi:phosphonate transport system ATP-binding protein
LFIKANQIDVAHPAAPKGAAALRGLSMTINAGEHIAIIGPSGAGKTTLLYALACALAPSSGQLMLNGSDPWRLSAFELKKLRASLFLAPQVPPLPPRQRVVTAVLAGRLPHWTLFQSLKSLIYPADIPAATKALSQFDLADKVFDRVDRLSGGERQRVALARLLLAQANLWLVDEPLSALDPNRATQALATITQEAKACGATLLCTLHQVEKALSHFGRIVGLRDGQLAFDLPASEVTPALLAQLYAQHEDELLSPYQAATATSSGTDTSSVLYCR